MRLRYNLTRVDSFKAAFPAMAFHRFVPIFIILISVLLWWSVFASYGNLGYSLLVRIMATTFIVAIDVGGGLCAVTLMIAAQSILRRDKGVIGEHTLEITDEGLVESTEVNRSLSNWRTPFRIRETRRYVYIYISCGSAHVVPKAKPPLEGSVTEFIAELRSRIENFRKNPVSKN